jgi:type IV secretion system protein VirB4
VLASPISRTLIEQTPTKVFFPNADANWEDYGHGFTLSEREFGQIKQELEPGSRRFLLKQGHQSVVCGLDLMGFDAELGVISGRRTSLDIVNDLIRRLGADPRDWLPSFYEQVLAPQARSSHSEVTHVH